ncbi:MAG: lamin tail domain-containing protein [Candidatus Kerfeldbacteria bacterium]|nr:lamin tail domain-containing protein [Candidatus Kerfeldbacteria bacterium]
MFIRKFAVSLTVVALLIPAGFGVLVESQTPSVVINELLWMGSPASSADEWIELRNLSETAVDLSGWKLTRKSSGQEVAMLTIPNGKSIEPRGFFLISNFAASSSSTHLAVEPDVVDTAVSLLNSGLVVRLYDAGGALVDVADDGSGTPLAGKLESGTTYAAMARNGLAGDGTKPEQWHTASVAVNLKPDSFVRGTPRAANENVPPVVASISDQIAVVGQAVTFDASESVDPDGVALVFEWEFGDGGISDVAAPTHVYAASGTFHGGLTVRDDGASTTMTFAVTVSEPTLPTPVSAPAASTPAATGSASLSELLPTPVGPDDAEFIELVAGNEPVDLTGWSLSDASGTTFKFAAGTVMAGQSWLVVKREQSRIALNNDTDTVTLRRPDSTVAVDEVTFTNSDEGLAYVRHDSRWQWTTQPTPGAINVVQRPNHDPRAKLSIAPPSTKRRVGTNLLFDGSDSEDEDSDKLTFSWQFGDGGRATGRRVQHVYGQPGQYTVRLTVDDGHRGQDLDERTFTVRPVLKGAGSTAAGTVKSATVVTTLAEAKTANTSDSVVLSGWVSAPPHALGEGLFYLTDGSVGMAVRASVLPSDLQLGQAVTVRGQRRTRSGEAYVLVENADGIARDGSDEIRQLELKTMLAGELDREQVGLLVQLVGEVTMLSGSRFAVDDGSGEASVYVRASTGFKRPALRSGDRVRVVGILSQTANGLRVLPRIADDVAVLQSVAVASPPSIRVQERPRPTWWMYVLVAGAVVAGVGVGWWRKLGVRD